MAKGRVGILTSGGDCSGLNAVIASVVKVGIPMGYEFVGFERGWEGVLSPITCRPLGLSDVRGISFIGGTILKTTNRGRFGGKVGAGGVRRIPDDILEMAKSNLQEVGIDALVVIGGDGTLNAALQLEEFGVKIIGVPKTIDNDLMATDRTFGFSTAVQVVTDALDRIHTTASSHSRILFLETMGRHAGWIALRAGLAGGADAILLPEFPFKVHDLMEFLRYRQEQYGSSIVVVAEGAMIDDRQVIQAGGKSSEVLLGGVSTEVMRTLEEMAPGEFEMRGTVLGHVQRGGTPNPADRILAKAYGVEAIKAVDRGESGVMVAYQNQEMCTVPIADACGQLKTVRNDTMEYVTARDLGVFIH
ncbi:PfkA 6-phosphofructokinase [Fimbriimonadaceae bacterium]